MVQKAINIEIQRIKKIARSISFLWLFILVSSIMWNLYTIKSHTKEIAISGARANFNKDQAIRLWATKHGGVYVPMNERTPANPSLSHIPDRNIVKPNGDTLTLMNPAYMIRQMFDEYPIEYGTVGRIVSLKPLNPNNAPDEWEKEALLSFEKGEKEKFEFTDIDGEEYLRLIQPMITKEGCLKCHALQGYKVGDVRGGVGVSIKMHSLLQASGEQRNALVFFHLLILFVGFVGIWVVSRRNIKKIKEKLEVDELLNKSEGKVNSLSLEITKRKQAEEALRESENRVRTKLDAILLPEGNLGKLELEDILDVPVVRGLMENIFKLTGIAVALGDLNGKALVAFGWQDVCTQFHRSHPESCKNCTESDTFLASQVEDGKFKKYKCKNNLWDVASPIYVGGRHVGNLFVGQFFYVDEIPDITLFKAQAKLYGFNEAEYLSALDKVPRVSREFVTALAMFYTQFSAMISNLSYGSIQFARMLKEQELVEEELIIAKEKAEESEKRHSAMIENIGDVIAILGADGLSKYQSPNVTRWFGWKPEELIGSGWDKMHPEDVERVQKAFTKVLETDNPMKVEYRFKGKDGVYKWIEVTASNRLNDPTINGVLLNYHDITERKQTEEEIRKAKEQAEKSNKELEVLNATKDKFFSIIAHDLKSPFNSIVGFSNLLVEQVRGKNYDGIEKYAGVIEQSSNRAMDLLLNLMEWSRSQTGRMVFNPEHIEMVNLINETELLFDDIAAQKTISIVRDLPANAPVFADKAMISTVLRNLISNAIKFTQTGGEIIISTKEDQKELTVSVCDNGVGIPKAYIKKIFRIDEDYSTSGTNKEKGTGLGLILCKEFVEKHEGNIWAESEEGKGSTFYFTLPK